MKTCPECGSPEHPSWKAHVFVSQKEKVDMANEVRKVVANRVRRGTYEYRDVEKRRVYQRILMAVKRGKACWWPEKPHAQ